MLTLETVRKSSMQIGNKRKAIHLKQSITQSGSNDYQVLKSFSKEPIKSLPKKLELIITKEPF